VVTQYDLYIKRFTGAYGWSQVWAGSTDSSAQQSVSGATVRLLQARVTFPTAGVDGYVGYFKGVATGGTAMIAAVRGYAQSAANNTSVSGCEMTGEIIAGGSTHTNGHVAGVQAMCATDTGLTITGGALFSLVLTANLQSAVTSMQHGGAAFIALTDQNGSHKVKYLIDSASDASSQIDTGSGNSGHLECYNSGNNTFTCKGGYRIYTLGAGEMYIPFGVLS
jgi:hypothetical protein